MGFLGVAARRRFGEAAARLPRIAAVPAALAASGSAVALTILYQGVVSRLIANSNVNLLRFSLDPSFSSSSSASPFSFSCWP